MVSAGADNLSLKGMKRLIDSLYDGVSLSDKDGNIIKINEGLTRITGLPPEIFLNQPMMSLFERGYFKKVPFSYRALTEIKTQYGTQEICTGKTVFATASPVLDGAGRLRYVVVVARELDKQAHLDRPLQRKRAIVDPTLSEIAPADHDGLFEGTVAVRSPSMLTVLRKAAAVGSTDATVLLLGETGVGKEVVAKFIHRSDLRRNRSRFVQINCNAIPNELAESEFFGYERGAFTGARGKGKPGVFESAHGGTLLLDEIGDLPIHIQGKLLRVLENGTFRRIGGNRDIRPDVRIIASTNRDLSQMVHHGSFRQDLYYRLSVVPITIPPLRERPEDTLVLLALYLKRFNKKYQANKYISPESLDMLTSYAWPGNVRELINMLERLVITLPHDFIQLKDLTIQETDAPVPDRFYLSGGPLKQMLEEMEKSILVKAKRQYRSSRKVARALGLSHTAVLKKCRKYGLAGTE